MPSVNACQLCTFLTVCRAKFSHGETVRNVSHGLRRPRIAGRALPKAHPKAHPSLAAVRLTATDADAPDYMKRKAGGRPIDERYGSISSRSICRQTRLRKRNAIVMQSVGTVQDHHCIGDDYDVLQ